MKVSEAIQKRHSCRAFLDRPVDPRTIENILRLASRAPSGANTQPWRVAVVTGATKRSIAQRLEAAFRAGEPRHPDYRYYPVEWAEPFVSRRFACGMQLYDSLGIDRGDKERRAEQWIRNYRSFDAPLVLYVHMDGRLEAGSYLDMGMFLQSVMLLAEEAGLATCAQQALAEYPAIVKDALGIEDSHVLLCGIAVGYEDTEAAVNHYRTPRADLVEFVRFHD